MVTFANDSNGHTPRYYIPVTITSPCSAANFHQMVTINSNTNSSYYNATLLNVNWQDGAGNILYSWLESGETKTSTASVYWILIPTGSTTTIYQVLYGTSETSDRVRLWIITYSTCDLMCKYCCDEKGNPIACNCDQINSTSSVSVDECEDNPIYCSRCGHFINKPKVII